MRGKPSVQQWFGVIRLALERSIGASEFLAKPSWSLVFPPVPDSNDEYFHIEVMPGRGSKGVRLRAVAGEGAYPPGELRVEGRVMPAHLRFATAARYDTAVERLVARVTDHRFATSTLMAAFALMSVGLVVLLKALIGLLTS